MGKMSRTKGLAWERRVARELTEATGHTHQRILTETRDGNCGDVRAKKLQVIYQCKAMARPNVFTAVAEAEAVAGGIDYAVAAIKRTHGRGQPSEYIAAMPWSDYLDILAMLVRSGELG